jgi:glycosyltransferase involved in cell wall biosynthesis
MNRELSNLKEISNVDIIFLSGRDHNEGSDNHGLYQMFKFMRDNLTQKSLYISTEHAIYCNNRDTFSIADLGGRLPLSSQINTSFKKRLSSSHWEHPQHNTPEEYYTKASEVLIEALPDHKFIALCDKADINLMILEKVLHHFNSRVIILSAVNNTWTGYCSYPTEHHCEKFKTSEGCRNECPALPADSKITIDQISDNFQTTKRFVERNTKSVYLNVGNSHSAKQASESNIFKDVETIVIPLKNQKSEPDFNKLWEMKKANKDRLMEHISSKGESPVTFFIFWTAFYMTMERKGLSYLIESLKILKDRLKERFTEICLITCAHQDEKYVQALKEAGVRCIHAGFCSREKYNFFLSLSDVYCSTTISDAGPRTNYESAALATPVVSFDRTNALDFVTDLNGALVETYDVEGLADAIERFFNYGDPERHQASLDMHKTYNNKMDTESLVSKWDKFFKKFEDA